jgi:hypothetical protein
MAVNKRKRTKKISRGEHGATKHPLTGLQKVLAGKGQLRSIEPIEVKLSLGKWMAVRQNQIEAKWLADQRKKKSA